MNSKDKIVLKGTTREKLEQLDKRETQCLKEIGRLNDELRKIELDPSLLKKGKEKPEIEEKSQLTALKTLQSVIRGHSDRMDLVRGSNSRSPSVNSFVAARSPSPRPETPPRRRRSPPGRHQRELSPPRREQEDRYSPPPSPRRRRSPPRRESPLQRRAPSPRRRNNRYPSDEEEDDYEDNDRGSQYSSSQRGSARVIINIIHICFALCSKLNADQ